MIYHFRVGTYHCWPTVVAIETWKDDINASSESVFSFGFGTLKALKLELELLFKFEILVLL